MKINGTATVGEQPELHRGESNESSDPTMAFLAALVELIPGLISNPVPIAGGSPTDTNATSGGGKLVSATTGAPGVAIGDGLTTLSSPVVASTTSEAVLTSLAPTGRVAAGLPFGLPNAAVADAEVVTKQPLIAADRASLPASAAQLTSGSSTRLEVSLTTGVQPKAISPEIMPVTAPLGGASAAPVAATPAANTISSTDVVRGSAALPGLSVASPQAPVVTQAPVAAQVPAAKSEIAPDRLVTAAETVPPPIVSAENSATAIAKREEADPVSTAQPTSIASKLPLSPAAISNPVDERTGIGGSQVNSAPVRSNDREPGHAKSIPATIDNVEADQPAQVPANIAATTPAARPDSTSAITTTVAAHPHLASQIAPYVAELRHGPDGTHQITVALHPADLGQVQVVVEFKNGVVHVQLAGSHDAAREALSGALPQLRRELTDSGLSVGRTDVLSQDAGTPGGPMTGGGSGRGGQLNSEFRNASDRGLSQQIVPEMVAPAVWRSNHAGAVDVVI